MSKDLIRLMNAFFLPGADACHDAPWQPNVDVYRTRSGWLIKFELAGVRVEEIEVEVLGRQLTLRGIRRDTLPEECMKKGEPRCVHHQMEINYGRFEGMVEIPCELKKAEIQPEYRDGLLLIHITPNE